MLRPYQEKAVDEIRAHFAKGTSKVLLHLATGGGKTVVFSHIMKTAAERDFRPIMLVRGRELVDQAHRRLLRENVNHGVLMANHWLYRPHAPIQLCSIDTVRARRLRPKTKLIVIDEAHMATSQSYREFLSCYPDAFILGVTATPYPDKPLDHIASAVVAPISIQELIDQGYLVPPRYFAPSSPDLKGVRISAATKDYVSSELSERMDTSALLGDLVEHWEKYAKNRPTICFAVSITHSQHIVAQFNKAGIAAEHCDADTPDHVRKEILKRVETGETKIVSNVGILCTGVDLPFVSCIIMARPTKSSILYIQQAGRGTRTARDKSDFILLDHAGNVVRHGFITDEREPHILPAIAKDKSARGPSPRVCADCYAVYLGVTCPNCGCQATAFGTGDRDIETVSGQLAEIVDLSLDAQVRLFINQKKLIAKQRGYKRGWIYYQVVEEFGEEIANEHFQQRKKPWWVA